MKKKVITLSVIGLSLVIVLMFVINFFAHHPFNEKRAQSVFNASEKELCLVAEYLASYDYPDILILEANGKMKLLLSDEVEIENKEVNRAIKKLFTRGYKSISKNENDNAVHFLKKTRFTDFGSGVVYAIDDRFKPKLQFLTKLTPLEDQHWYYYEEDYNEWRLSKH